jgi:hypothetical protein
MLILGAAIAAAGLVSWNAATTDLSAQTSEEVTRPAPGRYKEEVRLVSLDLLDPAPNSEDIMRSNIDREFDYCLTELDAQIGFRTILTSPEDDCTYQRYNAYGGTIDAELTCDSAAGDVRMVVTGTISSSASDRTLTITGELPGGDGTMIVRRTSHRVGDC